MDPIVIALLLFGNSIIIGIFFLYVKKFNDASKAKIVETNKRERELKRQVLELQVLRSLGERVGYSLDLHKILEVITDSLKGLVDFSTVSFMLLGSEGRITLKIHVEENASRVYLEQVKALMLSSFSAMCNQNLHPSLVDETTSGSSLDERQNTPLGSYFNLPIIIGGQVVALINVSSVKNGLYGDEETTVLYTIINQVTSHASKFAQVLENEKRKLSAMISSLSDGIIMVDTKFNLLVANPSMILMLNLPPTSGLIDMFSSVSKFCDLKSLLEKSLTTQQIIHVPPMEINGIVAEISVEPVKDKFGYLLGALVVMHDITAQSQLEKLRQDFTSMMVHELRTPLTTIYYGIETIISDLPKITLVEVEKYLKIIKVADSDMLALVNDLLDVARIESGKFEVVKKPDDLSKLIEEKIEGLRPISEEKKLKIEYKAAPNLPTINFDKVRIGQALTNLISNAIKYTDQGIILVSTNLQNDNVLVSVSDSGEGIKEEDIPKLFSKFSQLGKGKTGEKGGTGLGLVISKGIIEAHGGTIWAHSNGMGQGTTFTFSLPQSG